MLGRRAQAPARRDRTTFAQRRARAIEELALSVIADVRSTPEDLAAAREALMGPRGPRGQQRWAIATMAPKHKAQLRRLLREALGEQPQAGDSPGPCVFCSPPPPPAAGLDAAPTVAIEVTAAPAPPPDPLEDLGTWPAR